MADFTSYKADELDTKLSNFLHAIQGGKNAPDKDELHLLLDNLQLHQLELETKNHELTDSQVSLEKARDKYADLYDFSPIGYISFDVKGNIQEINLTACKLLGFERLVVLGKPFTIFLPLNESLEYFKHLKQVSSCSAKVSTRTVVKTKMGKLVHVQLESICHLIPSGQKVIQSAVIDITERVDAAQLKVETENQLHTIINALPVLVAHLDSDCQYIFSNSAYNNLFPVKGSLYDDKHLCDIVGEKSYNLLLPHIKSTLNGNQVICEVEIEVAGKLIPFLINLLPKFHEVNAIDSYYMIMTDISVYKRKELDVLTHLTSLAHESRICLIGQMTAEIAHEINQPLAAISNYSVAALRMLMSGKLEMKNINKIFYEIDEQVNRASDIINHLKKFSKKRELQRNTTNINGLIKDVLKLMVADKHWFNVEIETILDPADPSADIDAVLIEQVLINLIRNAIEAMVDADGDVHEQKVKHRLKIRTAITNDEVIISIEDNGPGISYEMQDAIFAPFFSTKETGVGLGLSICKSIIESHEGKLWATHNAQKGSTFYIELPVCELAL